MKRKMISTRKFLRVQKIPQKETEIYITKRSILAMEAAINTTKIIKDRSSMIMNRPLESSKK